MKRLKQAWKRDRLGVLGVGAAVVAFVVWAFPKWECGAVEYIYNAGQPGWYPGQFRCIEQRFLDAFSDERLPVAGGFLALAFVLLLLRRR